MKYKFTIKYVDAGHRPDPEQDESGNALTMIKEVEAHESVPLDTLRQQVAFELEEQHYRILSIEGEPLE